MLFCQLPGPLLVIAVMLLEHFIIGVALTDSFPVGLEMSQRNAGIRSGRWNAFDDFNFTEML